MWFVDLAALDRDGDVAGAALAAVGIADQPGIAALDTLAAELSTRRLLLVLDNCEHVIAPAAEIAARVLRDCPGVRILSTSREPLAIDGERVERLEPLATTAADSQTPAAVRLFLERAAGHGVSRPETAHVLDTIREVCVRLDGIPLAIELAAGRTRAISPSGLLAHLDDRLRLLARPDHASGSNRQQTLEAAIAWSYDLLSAADQATLRRLSVFRGGFSLAAAAAVCADIGGELDTLDRVTALVDRSVVSIQRRGDGERYRLLESIGLFAEQRLREQEEHRGACDRHARFFLELAQAPSARLHSAEQTASAARLAAEQDNLTAALSWCLEGEGNRGVGGELGRRHRLGLDPARSQERGEAVAGARAGARRRDRRCDAGGGARGAGDSRVRRGRPGNRSCSGDPGGRGRARDRGSGAGRGRGRSARLRPRGARAARARSRGGGRAAFDAAAPLEPAVAGDGAARERARRAGHRRRWIVPGRTRPTRSKRRAPPAITCERP